MVHLLKNVANNQTKTVPLPLLQKVFTALLRKVCYPNELCAICTCAAKLARGSCLLQLTVCVVRCVACCLSTRDRPRSEILATRP
jgi:hypothetical protein